MNGIAAELAAALPSRVVTRGYVDFSQRDESALEKGVYTFVSMGIEGMRAIKPRGGVHSVFLLAQCKLAESAHPWAAEDAEFGFLEEITAWLDTRACQDLSLKAWRQSGQLDAPFAWCVFEMERKSTY